MFSIVIPLYNKRHTIARTLLSVLRQTYQEFEVLIVNDGSTDDGVRVIDEFLKDSRFILIEQNNLGVSAARNRGIALAKFNYIALLDGDDEWLPGFLENVRQAIRIFPNAGMYGCSSWHRDYLTGEGNDATLERYRWKVLEVEYFENPSTMPHTSAMVISKKAFSEVFPKMNGFPEGMKSCEDWSCFYRMAFIHSLVYIGFPLGVRNNNVPGQTTKIDAKERFEHLKYVVDFYNLTYSSMPEGGNKLYLRFLRYDLRHRFICMLREKDWRSMDHFVLHLHESVKRELSTIEIFIYKSPALRPLSFFLIYLTKIIWRMHGYPIVGANK